MIRTFDVRLNAAHPELPLMEATAIVGSPSTANIYNVPKQIGTWDILKVFIQVSYPNGSTVTEEAVKTAQGIWTATVPMCEMSGRVKSGFTVIADGEDENGDEITGYILGVADFAVYTRGLVVRDGEKVYNLRYFDIPPAVPSKGDVAPFNGIPKLYDGYNWISFANDVDLSDYYTKEETDALFDDYYTKDETNAAIDALAAYYITSNAAGANFPTRAALLSATTYYSGGVVRTPTRNDYAVVLADEEHGGAEYRYIYGVAEGATEGQWEAQYPIETNDYTALSNKPKINNVELTGNKTSAELGIASTADALLTEILWKWEPDAPAGYVLGQPEYNTAYGRWTIPYWVNGNKDVIFEPTNIPQTATTLQISLNVEGSIQFFTARKQSLPNYQLGNQYDKPLASAAEAEALRTGKLDKSGGTVTGNVTVNGEVRLGTKATIQGGYTQGSIDFIDPVTDLTATLFMGFGGGEIAYRKQIYYKIGYRTLINYTSTDTTDPENPITYGSANLADRTANAVEITVALDELRLTLPAEIYHSDDGYNRVNKVRDFYVRVTVGTGSAALAAPAIVPIAPTGETITIETEDGSMPTIADGSADSAGVTLVYFTETSAGKFLVKAETITEVA